MYVHDTLTIHVASTYLDLKELSHFQQNSFGSSVSLLIIDAYLQGICIRKGNNMGLGPLGIRMAFGGIYYYLEGNNMGLGKGSPRDGHSIIMHVPGHYIMPFLPMA